MRSPLVSIIITSFNQKQYLIKAIESVLRQDYSNIELIVSDDGSSDFEQEKIEKFILIHNKGNIEKFVVIKNNINLGTVKNINGALLRTTGKYIKFLDGDDLYKEDSVRKSVEFMECNNYVVAAGHTIDFIDDADIKIPEFLSTNICEVLNKAPKDLYIYMCKVSLEIHFNSCIFNRTFFDDEGKFDERYRLYQDRPMLLRISKKGYSIGYINEVLYLYRTFVGVSSTGNIQLLKDCKNLVEYEYYENCDLLGKRFCKRQRKRISFIYDLKTKFVNLGMIKKILYCVLNADVIFLYILPEFGIKGLLKRFIKYRGN